MVKCWENLLQNLTSASLMKTKHIGSNFDDFLREESIFDQSSAVAIKRAMAWQTEQKMINQELAKTVVAKKTPTSRATN